ncbi:MAG: hypothetical protein V4508_10460 [Pseudomonadota bacterium]
MKPNKHPLIPAVLALSALLFVMVAAHGQTTSSDRDVDRATAQKQASEIKHGDPARWYKEDRTLQARLHTLQKEIAAAQQEAQLACRNGPAAERSACLAEAREQYRHDMNGAREQVMVSR